MTLDLRARTVEVVVVQFDPLELSPVYRDLLLALGRGWSNKEMAWRFGKTVGTVKVQLSVLAQRSGLSRLQLAVLGSRMLEAMAS